MAKIPKGAIVGIDQVAATITAALIAKASRGDELGAVNLFFKIKSMLDEQEQRLVAHAGLHPAPLKTPRSLPGADSLPMPQRQSGQAV